MATDLGDTALVRRWMAAAGFTVAACAAGLLFGTHAPHVSAAAGTSVCGALPAGQTTWNAAGSPYLLCPDGVSVPQGATLNLDGALGPVQVRATGGGGLSVPSGTI